MGRGLDGGKKVRGAGPFDLGASLEQRGSLIREVSSDGSSTGLEIPRQLTSLLSQHEQPVLVHCGQGWNKEWYSRMYFRYALPPKDSL